MKKWFDKLFSGDELSVNAKIFAFLILVFVHIVSLFLLMYFKIEIANKSLVSSVLDWNAWLIIATGGLAGLTPALEKWKPGGIKNVVNQDVENQTVVTDEESVTVKKKGK